MLKGTFKLLGLIKILAAFLSLVGSAFAQQVKFTARPDAEVSAAVQAWKATGIDLDWWSWGVCAVDFSGDGKPDLVLTSHHKTAGSRFFRNRGDGTFEDLGTLGLAIPDTPHEFRPVGIDADGDKAEDLLIATQGIAPVLRNTGAGFEKFGPTTTGVSNKNGDVIDLNNDGKLDYRQLGRSFGNSGEWFYINDGAGKFIRTSLPLPLPLLPDELRNKLGALAIDKNTGNRYCGPRFMAMDASRLVLQYAGSYAGDPYRFGRYMTLMGDMVSYRDETEATGIPGNLIPLTVKDFTGDKLDDVVCSYGAAAGLYAQKPDGTFALVENEMRPILRSATPYLPEVHQFDFDRDGDQDILITAMRLGFLDIFENEGGAYRKILRANHWDAEGWAVADFNGDTMLDLAVGGPGPNAWGRDSAGRPNVHGDTSFTLYVNAATPPAPPPEPEPDPTPVPEIPPELALEFELLVDGKRFTEAPGFELLGMGLIYRKGDKVVLFGANNLFGLDRLPVKVVDGKYIVEAQTPDGPKDFVLKSLKGIHVMNGRQHAWGFVDDGTVWQCEKLDVGTDPAEPEPEPEPAPAPAPPEEGE